MEEDREYKDTVQKLFTFIEESPSQYHAVDTMRKHLEAAGYEQLLESGAWKLKSGGKYYVIRSVHHSLHFEFRRRILRITVGSRLWRPIVILRALRLKQIRK